MTGNNGGRSQPYAARPAIGGYVELFVIATRSRGGDSLYSSPRSASDTHTPSPTTT